MAHVNLPRLLKSIGKSISKPFKKHFGKEKNKNDTKANAQANEHNADNEAETCKCCFPKCNFLKRFKKRKEKTIVIQEEAIETPFCPEEENRNTVSIENSVSVLPQGNDDWLPDLLLTKRHKKELQANDWLDDRIIDAAQNLLKKQFNAEGLQSCLLSEIEFEPVRGPSVQIHFDSTRQHWLTSCFRHDHVEIADSLNTANLPETVAKQIIECYGKLFHKPTITIKRLNVHQQRNGRDCGVYAIANAFEFLSNGDPTCRYNQKRMRQHLIECLERGEITAFPKKLDKKKHKTCKSSTGKKKEVEKKEEDEKKTENSLEKKEISPSGKLNKLLQGWFRFGFQTLNRIPAVLSYGSNWQSWIRDTHWKHFYKFLMRKRKKQVAKSLSFPSDSMDSSALKRRRTMVFMGGSAAVLAIYFYCKKKL
uniref:Uncharacterized protein n=1 Tax=Xenopus tropicalis TaxID=8364 RepID=A0A1B8Y9C9_XENTR